MVRVGLALTLALAGGTAGAQDAMPPEPAGLPLDAGAPFDPVGAWPVHPAGGWYGAPGARPARGIECAPDPRGFPFDPCFPPHRFGRRATVHREIWARVEWLSWSFRDLPVPALVVTGDPTRDNAGIPGGGNVRALVGPTRDLGQFNGLRRTLGCWFDPQGELGGELSAFVFARNGTTDALTGTAVQPLSVPVIGTDGTVGVYDFSFPGRFDGGLTLATASQLWSAEGSLVRRWYGCGCLSFDTQFGYRYVQLNERLELLGRGTPAAGAGTFGGAPVPAGGTVFTFDSFRTNTEFHGAQVGGRVEYRRDMFTVTAFGKGGAGFSLQTLRVDGRSTLVTAGGANTVLPGGVRALPSNIGRDTNTDFSLLGETGIEIGLQVTKRLSLRVGYNLLFVTDVVRPEPFAGPVVSLGQVPIDPTFGSITGAARPVNVFRSSDFLAHGLTLGTVFEW